MTGTSNFSDRIRLHSEPAINGMSLESVPKKEKIVQTFSTSHTPNSNGLAKRYNKSLLKKTTAMLFDTCLESTFLGEAAVPSNYVSEVRRALQTITEHCMKSFQRKSDVSKIRFLVVNLMHVV